MRHRRNRFRKAPKSPFNEDGPNSQSLRRGLEWLQTHDRDTHPTHLSVEIPKPSEELRTKSRDESVKPATPDEPRPLPEKDPSQTETQIELKPDSAADANATQTQQTSEKEKDPETFESKPAPAQPQPTQTQPERTQPPSQPRTEPDKSPDKVSEIILELEESQAEEAEIRNASRGPRHRGLDPRRFPKHVNTISGPIDLRKHIQLCCICQHPERDAIEEAFLQWRRPGEIRREFKLTNRSCIYRHAHAFGLFSKRARHLRFGLENIIEESSYCAVSADSVIRAIRAHSCLDENGRWIEPPRKLIIVREVVPAPLPPPPPKNLIDIDPGPATSPDTGAN